MFTFRGICFDYMLSCRTSMNKELDLIHSCGLQESILVSVFKSLVLSHLRYSSTFLVTCSEGTLSDIQVLQNSLLRSIGVSRETAETEYRISTVKSFITSCSMAQVSYILNDNSSPLRARLLSARKTNSKFPFTIPLLRKESFKSNPVIAALIHLRDKVYGTGRTNSEQPLEPKTLPIPAAPPQIIVKRGARCPNPACPEPPDKLWPRLDLHIGPSLRKNKPSF